MDSEIQESVTKTVEWSAEDRCFVGSALPFVGACCHGSTESEVLGQLDVIVAEWRQILQSAAECGLVEGEVVQT